MRHGAARRRLSQVLDGTLPRALEQAVRGHVAHCGRCSRRLAELELCDRLVARLPLAVVPLAVPSYGERRLEGLARWGAPPPPYSRLWLGLEGVAVAAAAAALAGVVVLAGTSRWIPGPEPAPSGLTQVAYVMPAGAPY
jgi:anti-sigma factor RsiW